MKTIELFSGTGSFSKVAISRGFDIFRVEIDDGLEAELHKDILDVSATELPKAEIIWASPPCTCFSVASIGKNWVECYPKNSRTAINMAYVLKTLELIAELKPKYWFIENPRGMLRKLPFMRQLIRRTVSYCSYGDDRMKPTDIWTNYAGWIPKKICNYGDSCHVPAPRGSRVGTQGLSVKERSIVPSQLIEEIFDDIARARISHVPVSLDRFAKKGKP